MDWLFGNTGWIIIGALGSLVLAWFAGVLKQKAADNEDRRNREINAMKETISQQKDLTDAQANPMSGSQYSIWLRKHKKLP